MLQEATMLEEDREKEEQKSSDINIEGTASEVEQVLRRQ
jgi:hypothetical protein